MKLGILSWTFHNNPYTGSKLSVSETLVYCIRLRRLSPKLASNTFKNKNNFQQQDWNFYKFCCTAAWKTPIKKLVLCRSRISTGWKPLFWSSCFMAMDSSAFLNWPSLTFTHCRQIWWFSSRCLLMTMWKIPTGILCGQKKKNGSLAAYHLQNIKPGHVHMFTGPDLQSCKLL